jgi:hypothetical protein
MSIAFLLTFVLIAGWVLLDSIKTRHVIKIYFVIGIFLIWGTYLFINLKEWSPIANTYIYLLFIPIFLLLLIKVYKTGKQKPINIVAKQQNYWNISPKNIYDYYRSRIVKRDDRIETKLNISSKQLTKKYSDETTFFTGNIALKISSIELTKIADLNEIKNFQIYSMVFDKIKSILKYLEKDINLENTLKENDMCVEYFLLDLWDRFTKNFNLGTANLEIYAANDTQREFVGALDSISLSSIKKEGVALLYLFMKFKNRLPKDN